MDRREMVRWLVAAAALECLDGLAPDDLLALGARVHRPPAGAQGARALDAHAWRTVVVAAERIIPATDTPGATDAGVAAFADRMLADWYTIEERDRFLAGLRALDVRCRSRGGKDFTDCDESDQIAVLTAFDDEVTALRRNPGGANPDRHWFAMLKYLTVFGYSTSEAAMRRTFGAWPHPGRYDGCATVTLRRAPRGG